MANRISSVTEPSDKFVAANVELTSLSSAPSADVNPYAPAHIFHFYPQPRRRSFASGNAEVHPRQTVTHVGLTDVEVSDRFDESAFCLKLRFGRVDNPPWLELTCRVPPLR